MHTAIDLFAGCGGFSCGFNWAGFIITDAVEFDGGIAASYAHNHSHTNLIVDDIRNVDNNKYFKAGQAEIILGGPPCQGFSMAGARIRHNFVDDPRNYLFKHYLNIVKIVHPKMFIFENVKGILHYQQGKVFNTIAEEFEKLGYVLQYTIARATNYGIPQARERTILIGSQTPFELQHELGKTRRMISMKCKNFFNIGSVWGAIGDLPEPGATDIPNHIATRHNSVAIKRMQKVRTKENYSVLDENIKSIHSGAYGRLDPNGIAPTITTRFDTPSAGRFIHPYQDRTITPREAARLQSFPDDFVFIGNRTNVCKQIGNAVPPKMAYVFATMIKMVLDDECK